MNITTLENIEFAKLTACFNEGFSDYFVKFHATEDYLKNRWSGARVDYKLSAGGWQNGKLTGLLVHGIDEWSGNKTAFNAGTCVAPTARGNHFTQKAYDFLMPHLNDCGIHHCRLEVIQKNERAIKVYEKIGFHIKRELNCYAGEIKVKQVTDFEEIKFLKSPVLDFQKAAAFHNYLPSWEHNFIALKLKWEEHQCYTLLKNENLIGYIILHPHDARIKQFFMHPEEKGKGYEEFLFSKLAALFPIVKFINVDAKARDTIALLKKIGLKDTWHQFEMAM